MKNFKTQYRTGQSPDHGIGHDDPQSFFEERNNGAPEQKQTHRRKNKITDPGQVCQGRSRIIL